MAGPWEKYGTQGGPVVVPIGPRKPDYSADSEARARASAMREQIRLQMAQREEARKQAEWNASHNPDGSPKDAISQAPPGDITKTGEDYLKSLSPNLALQVKALAEGRRAFPTGAALRNPEMQALVAAATQYDPSLDAANAATRVATRKEFTSGASSKNISSLNTVLGHMGELWKAAQDLHNRGFTPWNTVANAGASMLGDPGLRTYQIAQQATISEMERAFRGAGGSEKDIQAWKESLSSSSSPAQFRGAMEMGVKLLDSRLQAMGDAYTRGMGKSEDPVHFLNPHAQAVYTALSPGGDGVIHDVPPPTGGTPPETPPGNPPQGPLTPASGPTRTVPNAALSAQVDAMMNAGATIPQINDVLQKSGFPPVDAATYQAAKTWMQAHPGKAYSGANITRQEDMSALQQIAGSPLGAFGAHMANDFTAGSVGALAGAQGRGALDAMGVMHPDASMVGSLIGGITGAGMGEAAIAARAPAAIARFAPRIGDAVYGGLSGFNNAEDGQGLSGAAKGATLGVVGGAAGEKAMQGAGAVFRGVQAPAAQALRDAGIPLTAGQILGASGGLAGRAIKKLEDASTSIPGIGNMIEARRMDGLLGFNKAAFDIGAAETGNTVQDYGASAIQRLRDLKSNAYSRALDPITIDASHPQFVQDVGAARQASLDIPNVNSASDAALAALQSRIGGAIDPNTDLMSGRGFQEAYRGLARTGRERANGDYGHEIGQVMRQGQDALASALETQNPGAYQAFQAANATNRRLNVLGDAVGAAKSQEDNLFTPAQLNAADANSATKLTGKVASSSGERPFYDLAQAGQQVLPSKIPDSGTASRLWMQRALATLGAAGVGGAGYATGGSDGALGSLAAIAALTLGGSKGAQRALSSALLDRPDLAVKIGESLQRKAMIGGAFGSGGLTAYTAGQ